MRTARERLRPWSHALLAAAAVAVAAALLRLSPMDALLLALVTFALVALGGTVAGAGREHAWPAEDAGAADGSRRDLAALTWTFSARDGRVSEAAVRGLRGDATRRLARCGVVLPGGLTALSERRTADAARTPGDTAPSGAGRTAVDAASAEQQARARALLGDRAWRTLTSPGGWLPSVADIAHCVEVIEGLDEARPDSTATEPTTPQERSRP